MTTLIIEQPGHLKKELEIPNDSIMIIGGVRIAECILKDLLNPKPGLYSFKRKDDIIEVTRHHELEALVKAI